MFNKLINKFFNKSNKNLTENSNRKNNNFLCSINFELNYDGTINILCYWPEFNDNNVENIKIVSTDFSMLIYMINNGFLKDDIIETFQHLINQDNPFDDVFISSVLNNISEHTEKHKQILSDMDPIIKPTNVFKQYSVK